MRIGEKASYVKGLVEGLEPDKERKESKMILSVVDLLCDISESVEELENRIEDLIDHIEKMHSRHMHGCHHKPHHMHHFGPHGCPPHHPHHHMHPRHMHGPHHRCKCHSFELSDSSSSSDSDINSDSDELLGKKRCKCTHFSDSSSDMMDLSTDKNYDTDCCKEDKCHSCDSTSEFYEVSCPACNTTVCMPEKQIMLEDLDCPNCGQKIELDLGLDISDDNANPDKNSDGE